jgi:endonuclease YncB( thermonuclease family)
VAGQRIRLHGIDAPELDQDGGEAARDHLAILINDRPVTSLPMDAYGRTVTGLFEGGRDICAAMIADGYAVAYRRYSTAYVKHERAARRRRRGPWTRCAFTGTESPAAYRLNALQRSRR